MLKIIDVRSGEVRFKQVGDNGKSKTISLERLIYLTEAVDLDFTEGAGENYRVMEVTDINPNSLIPAHNFIKARFQELTAKKEVVRLLNGELSYLTQKKENT